MKRKIERNGDAEVIRRLLFLVAGTALWFMFGSTPAVADNGPHVQNTGVVADGCASCHRTHTAKTGGLLKEAQPGLCYTCHGTTGTGANTDVVNGRGYSAANRGGAVGALRGGGFSYALINSATPSGMTSTNSNPNGIVSVLAVSDTVTSTHEVNGSTVTSWGSGAINSGAGTSIQLRCASCHDPHGNGNFRTLRSTPTQAAGGSVPIIDGGTKVYTTTNYWLVSATNNTNYIANVSAWCTTCHTRYLAAAGSGSNDSTDPIFAYRHISNGVTQGTTSCVQCHVAHGSNAKMGTYSSALTNPGSAVAIGGSRLLRIDSAGTCLMCHNR